jgi:hypothetical protein
MDDLLVLSHQAVQIMKDLEEFYRLKDGYAISSKQGVRACMGASKEEYGV